MLRRQLMGPRWPRQPGRNFVVHAAYESRTAVAECGTWCFRKVVVTKADVGRSPAQANLYYWADDRNKIVITVSRNQFVLVVC